MYAKNNSVGVLDGPNGNFTAFMGEQPSSNVVGFDGLPAGRWANPSCFLKEIGADIAEELAKELLSFRPLGLWCFGNSQNGWVWEKASSQGVKSCFFLVTIMLPPPAENNIGAVGIQALEKALEHNFKIKQLCLTGMLMLS